jgi:hypothetical protein
VERQALGSLCADAGQPLELIDQPLDRLGEISPVNVSVTRRGGSANRLSLAVVVSKNFPKEAA